LQEVDVHNPIKKSGFTLIELLIAIALMALIVGALDQVAARILSTYSAVQSSQDLVPQARYALERMVTFVQESDYILTPPTAALTEELKVSERLSDQYTNSTRVYTAAGDGLPDADNNYDGLIDQNRDDAVADPWIKFYVDNNAGNRRLIEKMPNYSTSTTSDFTEAVLCEHVTEFSCRRLLDPSGTPSGIVEITLKLQQGNKTVKLSTTAKARWVN
jgi:prepilin-type N-terminal cleavage/methylation domain-containing protein